MELRKIAVGDFETDSIEPRPKYPPKPVGLAIWTFKQKPFYHAWGHPVNNNSSKSDAIAHYRQLRNEGYKFIWHHAGFDLDVMETHCGQPWPDEHHDTLLLAFMNNPRAATFSLKPQAEELLNEPPTERDELRDWIVQNVPEARKAKSKWAAYIARAPGDLVGKYACGDVTRTGKLFKLFVERVLSDPRQREAYDRERRLTRVLVRMERRGVPVATRRLANDIPEVKKTLRTVEKQLWTRLKVPKKKQDHDEFTWSGEEFADVLERARVVKEWIMTSPSKTHPNGSRMTGIDSLREVGVEPKLVDLLEVRAQISTCLSTFMEPWHRMGVETGGYFYARFNQVRQDYHGSGGKLIGTETGRLSMSPNLQNAPRGDKDERVPKVRDYIVPGFILNGKKYKAGELALGKRDYMQQELKLLAHEEGAFAKAHPEILESARVTLDQTFLARYQKDPGMDAHIVVRSMIHDIVQMMLERRQVKDLNFGLIYGMGVNKLALKLGVDGSMGRVLYKAHMKALPVVKLFKDYLKDEIGEKNLPVYTCGGRKYFKEPNKLVGERWMDFWYKLLNLIVQGGAADITKQAMVNYYESGADDKWPLILQVHDELLNLFRQDHKLQAHKALNEAMLSAGTDLKISLPMLSDGFWSARSWQDTKKHEVKL